MKNLLTILFLICTLQATSRNFYFSSVSGDDLRTSTQAQDPSTPWASITKLNSFFSSLLPGDSVLFKRGETFSGKIITATNGTLANQIFIGSSPSFGTGANAIISAFQDITSWTLFGTNIYEAPFTAGKQNLNTVSINNIMRPMGRYPNKTAANGGYLTYESHVSNTSITDNQLPASPPWAGGELVIRKTRWIIDKGNIDFHSGTVLTYSGTSVYSGTDGFGYFIQKHIGTLDVDGEWFYNYVTKKMYVYSASSPTNVKASVIDTLVYSGSNTYITFGSLTFTGANISAFQLNATMHITIKNCSIINNGTDGITSVDSDFLTIQNDSLSNTWNNSLNLFYSTDNAIITGNVIRNNALAPGMGKGSDQQYVACLLAGQKNLVQNNEIHSTGYHGFTFDNSDSSIYYHNLVDSFCIVKDDGGGIYSFTGNDNATVPHGRIVRGNIILHGIGAPAGSNATSFYAAFGIYMDDNVSQVTIDSNTVAMVRGEGVLLHNAHELGLRYNTIFDSDKQMRYSHDHPTNFLRNLDVKHDIFFSTAAQLNVWVQTRELSITNFGTIDSNYYCRPIDETLVFRLEMGLGGGSYSDNSYNLANWKTATGKDAASVKTPVTITDPTKVRFDYNATNAAVDIPLLFTYIDVKSVTNSSGNLHLLPWSSSILINIGSLPPGGNIAGYITTSHSGDPNVACNFTGAVNVIYTDDGTLALNKTVYNDAGLTSPFNGQYNWWGVSPTNGGSIVTRLGMNPSGLITSYFICQLQSPPTANAGIDQSIILPVNSVNLNGTYTTPGSITTFLWTKLSGPSGGTITSPGSQNTTATGLVEGTYVFRFRVTDNQGQQAFDDKSVYVHPVGYVAPFRLIPKNYYDLMNASGPLGAGNGPRRYFDVPGEDPINGVFIPNTTNGAPFRGNVWPKDANYPGERGAGVVFDLSGLRDIFNLKKWDILSIYCLDNTGNGQDTLYVHNYDRIIEEPNNQNKIMMMARPDSLLPLLAKIPTSPIGQSFQNQWVSVSNLTDSMRYMLIRTTSTDHYGGSGQYLYSSHADFSEIVIYGRPRFDTSSVASLLRTAYTGPYPKEATIKKKYGINNSPFVDPNQLLHFGKERTYELDEWRDFETTPFGDSTKYKLDVFNSGPGVLNQFQWGIDNNQDVWPSIRGRAKRINTGAPPVTILHQEPESPFSYAADGTFFAEWANLTGFGSHVPSVDRWIQRAGYVGYNLHLAHYVENGNEDAYQTLLSYAVRSSVAWDGHNHTVIPRGIKDNDSTYKLIQSGSVYLDSSLICALIFQTKIARQGFADPIPWKVLNFHWYDRTYNGTPTGLWPINPTFETQVGGKGRTPEQDFMPFRYMQFINAMYNELGGDTSVHAWRTEGGYDNRHFISQSVNDLLGPNTTSAVPLYPGYDSVHSKGIVMNHEFHHADANHIQGHVEYQASVQNYESNNNIALLFYTMALGGGGYAMPIKFPNYFYGQSFVNRCGDYHFESQVRDGDSTSAFVMKYRKGVTDSVFYVVFMGTVNGSTQNISINTGDVLSDTLEEHRLSFTGANGTKNPKIISANTLTVTAREESRYYFLREGTPPVEPPVEPPPTPDNKLRFGRVKEL